MTFENKDDLIIVSEEDAREYLKWIRDKSFCQSGQHVCDRIAILFAKKLKIPCL